MKQRIPKKLCRRCGGSGQLLRPLSTVRGLVTKLLNFKTCTNCRGHGIRYKVIESD